MLKIIKTHLSRINVLVIILLLVIHFVLKESNFFFSLLYYTFPLPIIIIAVVLFSLFLRKRIRNYNLILALILLVIWLGRSFKINVSEDIKETDMEVVFWNATHKREFKHVFDEVGNTPDVIVLVEYHAEELDEAKLNYHNSFFYWHSESEIGIFSKTPIEIKGIFTADDGTVVINFMTNNVNFYAVDVASSMHVYRKQQLEFVTESIITSEDTILIGDFNTPLESKFLNEIKINFNQVLNEKGNRLNVTQQQRDIRDMAGVNKMPLSLLFLTSINKEHVLTLNPR